MFFNSLPKQSQGKDLLQIVDSASQMGWFDESRDLGMDGGLCKMDINGFMDYNFSPLPY